MECLDVSFGLEAPWKKIADIQRPPRTKNIGELFPCSLVSQKGNLLHSCNSVSLELLRRGVRIPISASTKQVLIYLLYILYIYIAFHLGKRLRSWGWINWIHGYGRQTRLGLEDDKISLIKNVRLKHEKFPPDPVDDAKNIKPRSTREILKYPEKLKW